jgi:hypothetical protein
MVPMERAHGLTEALPVALVPGGRNRVCGFGLAPGWETVALAAPPEKVKTWSETEEILQVKQMVVSTVVVQLRLLRADHPPLCVVKLRMTACGVPKAPKTCA